ncbi:hypothetical protein SMICM304S_09330 [Streptomyces microflavus]
MATLPNPLPSLASSGLDLPPGSLVDATLDGPWHEPLLWYADGPAAPGDWAALRAAGRRLGLLPVLVNGGSRDQWPEAWDLCPDATSYAGDHDAEEVLAGYWTQYADDEVGGAPEDAPDRSAPPAPGPASPRRPCRRPRATRTRRPPSSPTSSPPTPTARWRWPGSPVPARRTADIPAAIGWSGPMNHENDVARLCAVLRSWEDRYDLRVVVLGFDTMIVSVGRPPTTLEEARALAAEHYRSAPTTSTSPRRTTWTSTRRSTSSTRKCGRSGGTDDGPPRRAPVVRQPGPRRLAVVMRSARHRPPSVRPEALARPGARATRPAAAPVPVRRTRPLRGDIDGMVPDPARTAAGRPRIACWCTARAWPKA